ncbi:dioxygenase [Chitinibacter bivalviorum]|uniref:Dioxygenase n=1 Tax=Chitinibacter bivalviorum TaxID=2739434 RepID=A0A7H9BIH3_9NEIS|nr:class III extradiol ring-cleavage dioxygenase [Chitinibacter bivalviorum]QLG88437.1 dioxygenase [Chitinibacter bivalviorum]
MQNSLFISHGAPTLIIDDSPAHHFLRQLGDQLPRPRLIVMISAHNIARQTTIGTAAKWREWHDFGGFPDELYQMQYRPDGEPHFAEALAKQLAAMGEDIVLSDNTALDHGAWVPLKLIYPEADIPVVTVSLSQHMDNAAHLALGKKLGELLPDDVLLIGSGSITHNLRDAFTRMQYPESHSESDRYADQFIAAVHLAGNTYQINDWEHWNHAPNALPFARQAHPSSEHFLPFLVARAAAGDDARMTTLHHSIELGVLGMDVIGFTAKA